MHASFAITQNTKNECTQVVELYNVNSFYYFIKNIIKWNWQFFFFVQVHGGKAYKNCYIV